MAPDGGRDLASERDAVLDGAVVPVGELHRLDTDPTCALALLGLARAASCGSIVSMPASPRVSRK